MTVDPPTTVLSSARRDPSLLHCAHLQIPSIICDPSWCRIPSGFHLWLGDTVLTAVLHRAPYRPPSSCRHPSLHHRRTLPQPAAAIQHRSQAPTSEQRLREAWARVSIPDRWVLAPGHRGLHRGRRSRRRIHGGPEDVGVHSVRPHLLWRTRDPTIHHRSEGVSVATSSTPNHSGLESRSSHRAKLTKPHPRSAALCVRRRHSTPASPSRRHVGEGQEPI